MPDNDSTAQPETEPDTDQELQGGEHELPDGAPVHPLIDLSRDPTPGKPDHARPEND